jgi:hypothetical protein
MHGNHVDDPISERFLPRDKLTDEACLKPREGLAGENADAAAAMQAMMDNLSMLLVSGSPCFWSLYQMIKQAINKTRLSQSSLTSGQNQIKKICSKMPPSRLTFPRH